MLALKSDLKVLKFLPILDQNTNPECSKILFAYNKHSTNNSKLKGKTKNKKR